MTAPALRAAALAMARLSGDNNIERRAEMIEGHVRVAVAAWLRARAEQPHFCSNSYIVALFNTLIAELDSPAGPIGEDQDD